MLHLITCHGHIMHRLAELLLSKEFLDILVNDLRSSGITVCQGFVVRGFQTISLFVKDVEVFLQVPCILCVRGFYGLGIGRFLHVQSVCWKFWYQRFLQILFFFVVVLWVYSLSDGFFRFSIFVRFLGVRTLLQVLWFGVLEVSRFKCQRISSGLVFQFEGLDQRFLQILFLLLLFCGFKVCQMVSSGSLCLSEFWVSIHCFRFFGLVC